MTQVSRRATYRNVGSLYERGTFRLTLLVRPPKKQSDDNLHPGASHEKSPSRLR